MVAGKVIGSVGKVAPNESVLVHMTLVMLETPQLAISTAWLLGRNADSVTSQVANAGPAAASPRASINPYIYFFMVITIPVRGGYCSGLWRG
ncbi:MAG: hypothetical protein A3G80_13840 [Betaproteobacteria bacterium RIFCSPLOWO2_12_FULL_62_13b]|nr:MAG: hypothetical protein A3G80_13840 [Betaproteobacteria bacterium RIFCSPLOWO2_12_FULL_62_13b]